MGHGRRAVVVGRTPAIERDSPRLGVLGFGFFFLISLIRNGADLRSESLYMVRLGWFGFGSVCGFWGVV